jgi:hypothetical protein
MNIRVLAQIIGAFVLILGIGGILLGEQQFANMMNTDIMLDMTRIALGAILIVGGMRDEKTARGAFAIFGIVYLMNFFAAIISPNMFGLLPHEFGPLDNLLHLGGGLLGVALAFLPESTFRGTRGSA